MRITKDSVYIESRGVAYSIVLELTFPVILLPPLLIDDLAEFQGLNLPPTCFPQEVSFAVNIVTI